MVTDNKQKIDHFDVVVVGAGPAGLSVGSELSKHFKVLVVDKRDNPHPGESQARADTRHSGTIPKNEVITNDPTKTTKSWFVPLDSVQDNADLWEKYIGYKEEKPYELKSNQSLAYGGVRRFLSKTFSGPTKDNEDAYDLDWKQKLFKPDTYPYGDAYPYIEESRIFDHWREIIEKNGPQTGSKIVYGHFYRDHHLKDNHVAVAFLKTKSDDVGMGECELVTVTCKLVIDASGVDSGLLKDYERKPNKVYWWSVYGCLAKHKKTGGKWDIQKGADEGLVRVGDYMLWQTFKSTNLDNEDSLRHGRPVFEYEILTEDTSFPLILYLRKERVTRDYMKAEFLDILRNEESTKAFHDVEIEEFKYGWYPSGGTNLKLARNRVDFIGDAGSWTTPCGWGMGFILKNYKAYAKSVRKLIQEDKLDQKSLESLVKLKSYQKTQFLLDKLAIFFLSNASASQLDKFIKIFKLIDPIICEKMFTLRIEPHEIVKTIFAGLKLFSIPEILKIVPREEYWSVFKDLVRLALEMIPNITYFLFFGKWPTKVRDFRVY